jgi:Cd(II)/Pb(II)-responsive transcriptional regulator
MAIPETFTIGELATAVEIPAETIRYYEREGLIPKPHRTNGNYRLYTAEHRDRLTFIRHCRSLDMSLDEVRALLSYRDAPTESCDGVNALIDSHIRHVVERMGELKRLRKQLETLRNTCQSTKATRDCSILEKLAKDEIAGCSRDTRAHPRRSHRT